MTQPKPGDLKVWYIPQIPSPPKFEVPVPDLATAAIVLDVLGKFALFEFRNRIKGDYADAGGVARYDDLGDGDRSWFSVGEAELAHGVAIGTRPASADEKNAELPPMTFDEFSGLTTSLSSYIFRHLGISQRLTDEDITRMYASTGGVLTAPTEPQTETDCRGRQAGADSQRAHELDRWADDGGNHA